MSNSEIVFIISSLSEFYNFNLHEALDLFELNLDENKPIENKPIEKKPIENKPVENKPIENKPILSTNMLNKKNPEPFEGIVFQDRCKAVVFNHGLYTQCKNVCSGEFCSSLCKKIKYGHINTRKDYPVGMYVLPNGKREIKLSTLNKRLSKKDISIQHSQRINIDDSDDEARQTISDIKITKRGRPEHIKKKIEYIEDDDKLLKKYYISMEKDLYEIE